MKFARVIVLAAAFVSAGVGGVHSQSLRNADEPAEFPPASYKGTQYIDSRGCVYVRAGISGNVTWVPRVTRSRRLICGQTPSLAPSETVEAPQVEQADKPVQITLEEDAVEPEKETTADVANSVQPVAKPKAKKIPKVATVATVAAKPKVVKTVEPVVQTKTEIVDEPATKVVTRTKKSRFATACIGVKENGERFLLRNKTRSAIRCGPQTEPYYGVIRPVAQNSDAAVPAGQVAALNGVARTSKVRVVQSSNRAQGSAVINRETRIVPKHVHEASQSHRNLAVPNGFQNVWEDGRLNPQRAEQNLAGQALVKLVWTQTVPRRLIDTRSGRDVTASTPLVYPYVDQKTQSRELGSVSLVTKDGKVLKRVRRNARSTTVRAPVVSSRSAKPEAVKQIKSTSEKAGQAQYIQVGTYGKQAYAQSTAKQIKRIGLPVRIGKYSRSGTNYQVVLAGPFGSNAAGALAKVRAAGYQDAFLR